MPAAVIERRRKLLGGGDIEIWPENALAVQVFMQCLPTAIPHLRPVGMTVVSGVWWVGIASTEIESTLRLLRIPPKKWPELAESVQVMSPVWAAAKNSQDAPPPPQEGQGNERTRTV